jgi:hypothetical protein
LDVWCRDPYDATAEMLTASLQTIGNAAKQIINLIAEARRCDRGGRG